MDDMREKLVELMIKATRSWGCQIGLYGHMADHLIANGVTFAEDTNVLTNADRIRAMSDEELLEFIDKKMDACIDRGPPKEDCYTVGGCKKCILEWLRQPEEGK